MTPPTIANKNEPTNLLLEELQNSLSDDQKRRLILKWNDPRRLQVFNNWHVIPERINTAYTKSQQVLITEILKSITSEDGYEKITKAMKDDAGGLGYYSAGMFSNGTDKLLLLITGRHQTIRANSRLGNEDLFGGPLFYGHAVEFYERPDHQGNVWWHQARLASRVYHMLDGKQQERALVLNGSPADSPASIELQGVNGRFSGIPMSELSDDQKEQVGLVIRSLLEPYHPADVDKVIELIKTSGFDQLHITFYKDGDMPDNENIWDRWKLEGPAIAWYFRGSPHVHSYINIGSVGDTL